MSETRHDEAAGSTLAEQIVSVNSRSIATAPSDQKTGPHRSVSTGLSVDEMLLVSAAGYVPRAIVVGAAVFHVGLVGARTASVELVPLSQALLAAREQATARMRSQAAQLGAVGVLAVHIEISAFEDQRHLAQVVVVGTAVSDAAGAGHDGRSAEPFVAAMSGQEFSMLVAGGYEPVNLVMGVCVYHIARQRPRALVRNLMTTQELGTTTAALYEARELAMRRLQEQALASGGEGVVGMTISEDSHVWGSKAIEFFCMGTTICKRSDARLREPTTAVSVRDPRMTTDPAALRGRAGRKKRGAGR